MQVLRVDSGAPFSGPSLTLDALTIAHGSISGGSNDYGGGLYNLFGTVTISNSTFAYNHAGSGGGGLDNEAANLSISTSTFAHTQVDSGGIGGGIVNGILGDGGNLSTSTIAYNSASGSNGGGLLSAYGVPISGSIVADNTGGDCFNYSGSSDQGYNLSSDSSCGFTGTGSLPNTNPKLGPLASDGGPTQTLPCSKGARPLITSRLPCVQRRTSGATSDQTTRSRARATSGPTSPNWREADSKGAIASS